MAAPWTGLPHTVVRMENGMEVMRTRKRGTRVWDEVVSVVPPSSPMDFKEEEDLAQDDWVDVSRFPPDGCSFQWSHPGMIFPLNAGEKSYNITSSGTVTCVPEMGAWTLLSKKGTSPINSTKKKTRKNKTMKRKTKKNVKVFRK